MEMKKIIEKYIPNAETKIFGNVVMFPVMADNILNVCNNLYHIQKLPLKTMTAIDERKDAGIFKIVYVFAIPKENVFLVPYLELKDTNEFPSLVNNIHEFSGYERRVQTFFGLKPVGQMDARPIILHENWPVDIFPLRKDFNWQERPAVANTPYAFQKVKGEGIYEIPVGPVHAGIIEPGHFRFSVAGEEIILLEAKLGYKHKGIEKLFEVLPLERQLKLSERISGDTSFTHSLAFCQAVEKLAGIKISERAEYLRVIFSELERLANHFNDIGFMMLDTGYSFGGSNGARLREMIMQWNEKLTGSRFLRGTNVFGGVSKDISHELQEKLAEDLKKIKKYFAEVIEIAQDSNSVYNRLKGTGTLKRQIANDHAVVGVAGRAAGIATDARIDFPYAAYDKIKFEMALETESDVNARFGVRIKEVYSSIGIILEVLGKISEAVPTGRQSEIAGEKNVILQKNIYAVGVAEGWRGEIVYFVATDAEGNINRVEVCDPSVPNWKALGHAGKGNVVPDFPLINKSFNLSYSGNDL
jgi:Ni,Fe-hydrogenase III large subunit/Ni,Fe-hydrogenase III component G